MAPAANGLPLGPVVVKSALMVTVIGSFSRADHASAALLNAASAGAFADSPAPGTTTTVAPITSPANNAQQQSPMSDPYLAQRISSPIPTDPFDMYPGEK